MNLQPYGSVSETLSRFGCVWLAKSLGSAIGTARSGPSSAHQAFQVKGPLQSDWLAGAPGPHSSQLAFGKGCPL